MKITLTLLALLLALHYSNSSAELVTSVITSPFHEGDGFTAGRYFGGSVFQDTTASASLSGPGYFEFTSFDRNKFDLVSISGVLNGSLGGLMFTSLPENELGGDVIATISSPQLDVSSSTLKEARGGVNFFGTILSFDNTQLALQEPLISAFGTEDMSTVLVPADLDIFAWALGYLRSPSALAFYQLELTLTLELQPLGAETGGLPGGTSGESLNSIQALQGIADLESVPAGYPVTAIPEPALPIALAVIATGMSLRRRKERGYCSVAG